MSLQPSRMLVSSTHREGPVARCFLPVAAFLLLALLPSMAHAEISLSLTLDRRKTTVSDTVRMVVSLSGTRGSDSRPTVNGTADFRVSTGGTSSRIQIINGKVDTGMDYTFFLQPKKAGDFRIGPAEIRVEGKTFKSNTAALKVRAPTQTSGVGRKPIFLQAEFSSAEAYVEEQIVYTLKLYRQVKVSNVSLDMPESDHLVFRKLGEPTEYQSVQNGTTYQVLEVRYAVMASKEGNYAIEPARMGMTVFQPRASSRRSFFDDPFFSFSRGTAMTFAGDPLELHVRPLPEEGRPPDFSGLVGRFRIDSRLDPPKVRAGESATLTVRLSGSGNVNRIPDLKMSELANVKVYSDQPVLEVNPDDDGFTGSKIMKWALVPEKEGRHEIPPLAFSFFDSQLGRYRTEETSPMSLSVLPGSAEETKPTFFLGKENATRGPVKLEIKALGHDILPAHTSMSDLTAGRRNRIECLVFWIILAGPFVVYVAVFSGIRFRRKSAQTLAATKAKKAAKTLVKQCRLGGLPSSAFAQAIQEYLNDRFALSLGSLTPEEAEGILTSRGVSRKTAARLKDAMQRLENAIYTGKGHTACDTGKDLPRLIKDIEKEIR